MPKPLFLPRMLFWLRQAAAPNVKTCRAMKNLWLALAIFVGSGSTLFGNGGAWQAGIPATGNASASKNDRHTDVTIENEMLKIDLHPEYADVTVRYRMHNTGPKVQQDFFFSVERWGANGPPSRTPSGRYALTWLAADMVSSFKREKGNTRPRCGRTEVPRSGYLRSGRHEGVRSSHASPRAKRKRPSVLAN